MTYTKHYSKFLFVGAFTAAIFVVGCGDDELSPIEFREQASAICVQGDIEIGEAVGVVFSGDDVGPDQLQGALDTIVAVSHRQLDEIDTLNAPSGMREDIEAFVTEGRSATDIAKDQGLAFFEIEGDPWQRTSQLAAELGLEGCVSS